MGEEKKKKKEEKEVKISDIFGGSLNILGMKVDIGKLLSLAERPGKIAEDLEKLRSELEKAGGKPVRVGGYIRTRPIIGARVPGWRPERRKKIKTIYIEGKAEEPERLVDIFDEGNKVRVLAEIPSHYKQEELKLEYQKKNGEGELIIRAPEGYERHISIKEELAAGLTGKVELRSFKSGIVDAELEKKKLI